ncbi:MAG: hypothetical protein MPL62_09730 [Alphaproteobacteria bacterium]|nr:hypothetical protein [Alphaproteobacteria bacterium]
MIWGGRRDRTRGDVWRLAVRAKHRPRRQLFDDLRLATFGLHETLIFFAG